MLAQPSAAARPASTGYYTEAGLGSAAFLGQAASYARPGLAFDLRAGRDLTSWLSLGAHVAATTHEATVPPPPEGEYVQLYTLAADARLGFSVARFALFAEGGVGIGIISSNVLERVAILDPGERVSLSVRGGAGIEYQLQNRHHAFGLAGDWLTMPGFASLQGISARLYLRYTY